MRTASRTPDRALLRDAVAIAAAMVAVGGSFGAIAIAYGLPTWVPFLMSTVVFAGGAQFLAAGLLAAGNPIAAVLAGLLLNAPHLPFGLAAPETIGPRRRPDRRAPRRPAADPPSPPLRPGRRRDDRPPLAQPVARQPPDDRRGGR